MANSPRPDVWILERSKDFGKTWSAWQFFADNYDDCSSIFGITARTITRDDSVICETKYSKILPLENGEIAVSLLNGRPSAKNFGTSHALQEFTKATNVRLRLRRPKTTLGHLISVARQDPTLTRRYFYSIKDINIGGRCVCNGHANSCDITDATQPQILQCKCQHNTCGVQCGECCPGFVQKKWKAATIDDPNVCEPCNCFGHSKTCRYNQTIDDQKLSLDSNLKLDGGGECIDCEDNTEGINCNKCKDRFYRPVARALESKNVCEPCQCDDRIHNGSCAEGTGKCSCKANFQEPDCNECSYGFTQFPECKACDCNLDGTIGSVCELKTGACPCRPEYTGQFCSNCSVGHFGSKCSPCDCSGAGVVASSNQNNECDIATGQCGCKPEFSGRQCDRCAVGFYGYPNCQYCQCDSAGTTSDVCDIRTGTCLCKPGFGGRRCDECLPGFFGFPNCTACECHLTGSTSPVCSLTGKCRCSPAFGGMKCADCSVGHFRHPDCLSCGCDPSGSHGMACDPDGSCICKSNFDGPKCDKCRDGFYNYPLCEECTCDPAGVVVAFKGCGSVSAGELCKCKPRVTGRICNQCKDLFWNLQDYQTDGCDECNCNRQGTIGSIGQCHGKTGQCVCRENVEQRTCDTCKAGSFALQEGNLFGCTECGCDIGGSLSAVCEKFDGRCSCKPKVEGRRCDRPLRNHFFPTLYQLQYEIEDGRTIADSPARFGYDESQFPDFSWRGYATFSNIMREVIFPIEISRPAFYRPIFRFVNPAADAASALLTLTPDNRDPSEEVQSAHIFLQPTSGPKTEFGTTKQGLGIQVLLSPGKWIASMRVDRDILVDYMVLMPEAYYEARLLREVDPAPCRDHPDPHSLCRHFAYPPFPVNVSSFPAGSRPLNSPSEENNRIDDDKLMIVKRLRKEVDTHAAINLQTDRLQVPIPVPDRDPRMPPNKQVIVVNFHTPSDASLPPNEPSKIGVFVSNGNEDEPVAWNEISFADCPYSFICRQVITGKDGEVAVFDLGSKAVVYFQANDITANRTMLIESVHLIPHKDWTLDYVKHKFVCVAKNGECIDSSYSPTTERKVEFERDQNPERTISIRESATPLVFVNDSEPVVEIRDKVQTPGRYNFIIHYKQPENPSFEADVNIQGDQIFNAMVRVDHCPSLTGCRALILQRESNSSTFYVANDFQLSIRSPAGKSLLVDYLIIIPVDAMDDSTMLLAPQDRSIDFIRECGQQAFSMDNSTGEHCKKAVFSLTADFNGQTFPCKCTIQGSKGQECNKFGGQCSCKPNVIGRQCSRCKTGFFGFPDCKPCNCPSTAYCDERTGKCICPPKVTGNLCDRCMIRTYGFDNYQGCEECNCHSKGVVKLSSGKADLQCDLQTGQCPCRINVMGRQCDRCLRGYAFFPFCQLCNCDIRGVQEEMCDQETAECFCKKNVNGESCDICTPDSFFMEEKNPDGCTKCFCFGITNSCRSSQLSLTQVMDMTSDFGLYAVDVTDKTLILKELGEGINFTITYRGDSVDVRLLSNGSLTTGRNLYISLPAAYLGKKISSYGGVFNYSVHSILSDASSRAGTSLTFDIILMGSNLVLGYEQDDQPVDPETPFEYRIELLERNFRHPNRNVVSREQMMMALLRLEQILVRVSYFQQSIGFTISHLLMDTGSDVAVADAPVADRVEQCVCPQNYRGTSCEECNSGFFRMNSTGPYLGYCVPCQCNNHADDCDVETGKCGVVQAPGEFRIPPLEPIGPQKSPVNHCKHNTYGEYCENCAPGYYGNATNGRPHDCSICPCPLPQVGNNFATSCDVSDGPDGSQTATCKCRAGYLPPLCGSCAAGFYGQPLVIGDSCKECQCNDNINATDPDSCDPISGLCLKCLNNTYGPNCEICAPGFYGDAIGAKNCKKCDCDDCGTDHCDHSSGQCICKENVVGEKCDRCADDHYGMQRQGLCSGCSACQCANASISSTCDVKSGQCDCQVGAGGRTCDTCEPGFWRYSADGCTSCNCGARFSQGAVCDQESGQCQCLPGVVGKNCDSCPWRWAFIEKVGCTNCTECHHPLLDDTDGMLNATQAIRDELKQASLSVFARRRADHVSSQIDEKEVTIKDFVFKKGIDLTSTEERVKETEMMIAKMTHNSTLMQTQVDKILEDLLALKQQAQETRDASKETIKTSVTLVAELKQLEESFNNPLVIQNVDHTILRGEQLLGEQADIGVKNSMALIRDEMEAAKTLIETVRQVTIPVKTEEKVINDTFTTLVQLNNTIKDLYNQSALANSLIVQSEQLNILNTEGRELIDQENKEAAKVVSFCNETIARIREQNDNSRRFLIQFESEKFDMDIATRRLEDKKTKLQQDVKEERMNPSDLRDLRDQAYDHSLDLVGRAGDLVKLFNSTKAGTVDALRASSVYEAIAGNASMAVTAAQEASTFTEQLQQLENTTRADVQQAKNRSEEMKEEAGQLSLDFSSQFEVTVSNAVVRVAGISDVLQKATVVQQSIDDSLSLLPKNTISEMSKKAEDSAAAAVTEIAQINERIGKISSQIKESALEAGKVPIAYYEINNDIKYGHSYTDRVAQSVPSTSNLTVKVEARIPDMKERQKGVESKIEEIRKAIDQARGMANRIELGVGVNENTSLQLRNPEDLMTSGIYTKFVLSFRTKEYNGLLAYIGNPLADVQRNRKKRAVNESSPLWLSPTEQNDQQLSTDFLALEIRNSRVILTLDLGSGPERTENGMFVSNDLWHDVVVERIGKQVTLLVSANDSRQERADNILVGTHSVFNVDPVRSKILIAGIPPSLTIQKDVANTKLKSGSIANVAFGDKPLGLWNFVEASGNRDGTEQKQIQADVPSNGMRFDSNSYVILPKDKFNFSHETDVQLKFKTFARDGLIFLIGGDNMEFVGIYLSDARVIVSYDLGSGRVHLTSKEGQSLNDGNWHTVDLSRRGRSAVLRIDGNETESKENTGRQSTLETNDKIFVGGYPGRVHRYPIPNFNFEGCIQDLQIENLKLDLNKNMESSPSVIKGCPAVVNREASFRSDAHGFIEMPLTSDITDYAVLTMKYRTPERGGLLFFASNQEASSSIALYIDEMGHLILRTDPGGEQVKTRKAFVGEDWHYVTATKDHSKILLEMDDEFGESIEFPTTTVLSIPAGKNSVYFGGVPKDDMYLLMGRSIPTHFVGCFGDVVLNNNFQNFATSANRPSASLSSCPQHADAAPTPAPSPVKEPEVPTTTPLPQVTETTTSITLSGCSIPLNPQVDTSVTKEHGLRFGNSHDTRLEVMLTASLQNSLMDKTKFFVEVKTTATEGLILYIGSKQVDFAALFVSEGRIHFSWNLGGKAATLRQVEPINDGQWHRISVSRTYREARLQVDDSPVLTGISVGEPTALNIRSPLFIGGLTDDAAKGAKNNVKSATNSLPGCLRNLKLQDDGLVFGRDAIAYGTQGCSDKVEDGVFFHSTGGHVILRDKFRVGERTKFDLKVKARTRSGVLLSVSGKSDFLMLQLVDGVLIFSVDNGGGVMSVEQDMPSGSSICDGDWHTVQAVKEKNIIMLTIDNGPMGMQVGTGGISSTDTNDPLFVGGVPAADQTKGLLTREPFVGCISDFRIADKSQSFYNAIVIGAVTLSACPTN